MRPLPSKVQLGGYGPGARAIDRGLRPGRSTGGLGQLSGEVAALSIAKVRAHARNPEGAPRLWGSRDRAGAPGILGQPHVRAFYAIYFDPEQHAPFYRQSSRQ